MDTGLHHRTPSLAAIDPRGLAVRAIAYARSDISKDAEARITRSAFDAAGRAIAQWDARFWGATEKGGENAGIPSQTTAYSLSGAVLCTESVDAGWRIGLADDAGQPRMAWDGRGSQRRTEYDAQLRPVSVHEQLAGEPSRCVERFTYGGSSESARNRCGRLLQHENTAEMRRFPGSGVMGQSLGEVQQFLVSLEAPDWEGAISPALEPETYATRWTHDALGAVLSQTDAMGNVQSSAFDVAGQVLTVSLTPSGGGEQGLVSGIVYNARGQVEGQMAGNGVRSTARYSAVDARLIQLQAQRQDDGQVLQDLLYAYDPMGNVERLEDLAQPTQWFDGQVIEPISTYGYDTLYQLIKATGRESKVASIGPAFPLLGGPGGTADASRLRNYTQQYSYDAGGNLTTLIHRDNGGQVLQHRTMAVDERSNRSLFWPENMPQPDIGAGFDTNGNQQRLEDQPMHWDARNQLKRVVQVARNTANAPPEDDEVYSYDGGGQRRKKVRSVWTGSIRHTAEVRYLPGLELRRNSATEQTYAVWSVQAGRSAVRHLQWCQGLPAGIDNGQYRYSLDDHLGSSTLELDHKGQVISHEGYHPYGGTAWWAARSSVEADYKTIRYSGKERDATGLYYYGFRYYAPWLNRWINPDPAGDVDGLNLFQMVSNNPATYRDRDGQMRAAHDDVLNREDIKAWARAIGTSPAAAGLANFGPERRRMVEDAVGDARYMLESARSQLLSPPSYYQSYPPRQDWAINTTALMMDTASVMMDFLGENYPDQLINISNSIDQIHTLISHYQQEHGQNLFLKFEGESRAGGAVAADPNLSAEGHIALTSNFFTTDGNPEVRRSERALIIIHEVSHHGYITPFQASGPRTTDYWYHQFEVTPPDSGRIVRRGEMIDADLNHTLYQSTNFTREVARGNPMSRDEAIATFNSDSDLRSSMAWRNADSIAHAVVVLSSIRSGHLAGRERWASVPSG